MPVVASEVATMTPTVKYAARRWPRTNIRVASAAVMIATPMVLKISSTIRSGIVRPVRVDRPRLGAVAALVEVADHLPALVDRDREEHEQDQARGGQRQLGDAGTVEHAAPFGSTPYGDAQYAGRGDRARITGEGVVVPR